MLLATQADAEPRHASADQQALLAPFRSRSALGPVGGGCLLVRAVLWVRVTTSHGQTPACVRGHSALPRVAALALAIGSQSQGAARSRPPTRARLAPPAGGPAGRLAAGRVPGDGRGEAASGLLAGPPAPSR